MNTKTNRYQSMVRVRVRVCVCFEERRLPPFVPCRCSLDVVLLQKDDRRRRRRLASGYFQDDAMRVCPESCDNNIDAIVAGLPFNKGKEEERKIIGHPRSHLRWMFEWDGVL
jgi:hypothetical protein